MVLKLPLQKNYILNSAYRMTPGYINRNGLSLNLGVPKSHKQIYLERTKVKSTQILLDIT